jgi:hypothetical protein
MLPLRAGRLRTAPESPDELRNLAILMQLEVMMLFVHFKMPLKASRAARAVITRLWYLQRLSTVFGTHFVCLWWGI